MPAKRAAKLIIVLIFSRPYEALHSRPSPAASQSE
jgi:hypothetical protein